MSEKKFLTYDEEDDLVNVLWSFKDYHITKKEVGYKKNDFKLILEYLLPFDCILDIPVISLYSCEDLLNKFPNGVVTENLILIPTKVISTIIKPNEKNEKMLDFHEVMVNKIFNDSMIYFVENVLGIEFKDDEKNKIYENSYTEQVGVLNSKKELSYIKPQKSTNKEILELIEGKNYFLEEYLIKFVSLEKEVKERLKENINSLSYLPSLIKKLENVKIDMVNEEISFDDFKALIKKASNLEIAPNIPLKIVIKKIKEYVKTINSEDDVKENDIFSFMLELNDLPFKKSVDFLKNELKNKNVLTNDMRNKLAKEIHNNKTCYYNKRQILIETITDYNQIIRIEKKFK